MARPRPPVYRAGDRYRLHIGDDERALIRRLLDELRDLLLSENDGWGDDGWGDDGSGDDGSGDDGSGDDGSGDDGSGDDGSGPTSGMLTRLFPVAHPDDPELEAEYQRLMRVELVTSKLKAIESVEAVIDAGRAPIDEAQLTAFMQSINSIRLVLGTLLDVTDDPDAEGEHDDTAEYQLYGYLSWLLEWTVRALSGA